MKIGWKTSNLDTVIDILRNGINCKQNKSGNGDKISRIESISQAVFDISRVGYSKLSDSQKDKYKLNKGDILFSHINSPIHVGKTAIFNADDDVYHGVNLLLIKPKKIIDNYFLEYYLQYLFQNGYWLNVCKQSVNQASVNQKDIKKVKISYPESLPEQKRIVRILDEAFEKLEKAKKNTQKNTENAKELFDSYSQSLLTRRNYKWIVLSLEELIKRNWIISHLDGNHGGNYPRKNEFIKSGISYISANCIKDNKVDFSQAKYLSPKRASQLHKGIAIDSDVLFAHNATVGPVAILKTSEEKVVLSTSLTYYRCNKKHISPRYLAHYMRSPVFTNQYTSIMRQSTRNQVPITRQRQFTHVIPPLKEQKKIANKLDDLLKNTTRIREVYNKRLNNLTTLTNSLLQKAFSGEL